MARRRSSTALRIVQAPAARPIIVNAPRSRSRRRSPVRYRRRARGRRRSSSGGLMSYGGIVGHMVGGAAFGFAVKQGWVDRLPAVPVIGRTGLAAILLNEAAKRGMFSQVTRPASVAAACLAGYQLGSEGSIHGEDPSMYGPDIDDEGSY